MAWLTTEQKPGVTTEDLRPVLTLLLATCVALGESQSPRAHCHVCTPKLQTNPSTH
jgi:hypothetical protein